MKNQTENEISYLKKQIMELPDKAKDAVCFMIENFDLIEEMCRDTALSQVEIQKRIEAAKEKEDYILMIILCAAKVLKNAEK
ncbi:MAG TPA: hypothetical protein DDY61_03295 [Ruminococcaceae bacterium]|nr:hypothetical protein [Oscillospiraceae bacterium]HBJ10723.1 hypothetical protein [Oscillospiraceae bacterium]